MDHRPAPPFIRWYIRYFKATLLNTTAYIAAVDAQDNAVFFLNFCIKTKVCLWYKETENEGRYLLEKSQEHPHIISQSGRKNRQTIF